MGTIQTRNHKGITLIALVITIIVLLILAGVTLSLVLGDNNLLFRAKDVKRIHDIGQLKQALELKKVPLQLDRDGNVDLDSYLKQLEEGENPFTLNSVDKLDDTNAEVVVDDQYKFLIEDKHNGNVEITYEGIAKKEGLTISPSSATYTYPISGTFEVTNNESNGELSVKSNNEEIAKARIEGTKVTVEPGTKSGQTQIVVTSAPNGKYAENKAIHTATVKNGEISLTATAYTGTYDGKEHNALISVEVDPQDAKKEYALGEEKTYTETMPKVTNAAEYTVSIKASKIGYTQKEITKTVTVSRKGVGNFDVTLDEATFTYTGSQIQPGVTVTDGSKTLKKDTDYTVSYGNNVNAGKGTVTVTGKGNYTGTKTVEFTINPGTITITATPYTGPYDGAAHDAVYNVSTTPSGATLEYALNKGNYGSAVPKVTGAGSYTVSIKASKTNYTTKEETKTVTVSQRNATNFTVSLNTSTYTYDGNAKEPGVTVKDGSKTLTIGTDYTVSYSNNVNAGKGTVTVTGKGNYTGTKTAEFTINKKAGSVSLSATSGTVKTGDSITFTATGTGGLSVSSSNTGIATASISEGTITVTGVASGSTTITITSAATQNCNQASANYTIKVEQKGYYAVKNGELIDVLDSFAYADIKASSYESGRLYMDSQVCYYGCRAIGVSGSEQPSATSMVTFNVNGFSHVDVKCYVSGDPEFNQNQFTCSINAGNQFYREGMTVYGAEDGSGIFTFSFDITNQKEADVVVGNIGNIGCYYPWCEAGIIDIYVY